MTYEIQYINSEGWLTLHTINADSAKHACMKFRNIFGRDVKVVDIKERRYYYHSAGTSAYYSYTTATTLYYNGSTAYGSTYGL